MKGMTASCKLDKFQASPGRSEQATGSSQSVVKLHVLHIKCTGNALQIQHSQALQQPKCTWHRSHRNAMSPTLIAHGRGLMKTRGFMKTRPLWPSPLR